MSTVCFDAISSILFFHMGKNRNDKVHIILIFCRRVDYIHLHRRVDYISGARMNVVLLTYLLYLRVVRDEAARIWEQREAEWNKERLARERLRKEVFI